MNLILERKPEYVFGLFVLAHAIAWTIVPASVNPNLPLDVIEGLAWGHEWQWGYHKHPIVKPWFIETAALLSGRADWAQYLLSQLCIVSAFWAVWRLGGDFFPPKAALLSVFLLEGIYYYNYTSPEFNANVAQVPFWALTVLFFWRGLTRNKMRYWILTGIFIGLGLLSKYSFVFLIAALGMMVISVKSFRKTLATSGPYVGAGVSLIVLIPHLYWAVNSKFATISYALGSADAGSHSFIYYPAKFLITQPLILLPALCLLWGLKKKREENTTPIVESPSEKVYFLLFITLAPFVLMILVGLFFGLRLRSMWGTPLFLFSGALFIHIFRDKISTASMRRFGYMFTIVFLIPLIVYWGEARFGPSFTGRAKRTQFPGRMLAEQVSERWREHFTKPAGIIIGSFWDAGNVAYYADHRASVFIDADVRKSPWISLEDIRKKGAVIIGRSQKNAYDFIPRNFDSKQVIDKGRISVYPRHPEALSPIHLWMLILPPEKADSPGSGIPFFPGFRLPPE